MPRPKKCRKVCQLPKTEAFVPQPSCASGEAVILTVDEYEAIRLIDREGFSQEECRSPAQPYSRFITARVQSSQKLWLKDFPSKLQAAITAFAAARRSSASAADAKDIAELRRKIKNKKEKQK